MIKDIKHERTKERMLPQEQRLKARSLSYTPDAFPKFNIYNRVLPKFPLGASFNHLEENEKLYEDGMSKYYAGQFAE